MIKVGDLFKVWWYTGSTPPNMAAILEIKPYEGKYKEHFTYVLKLYAPNTELGYIEMAVHETETQIMITNRIRGPGL